MTKDHHNTEARNDNDYLTINAPATSQNDEPITVYITGADPNSTVEFEASLIAEDGTTWQSNATFTPDANGTINLAEDEPDDGTWSGIESMAWLWSMRPDDEDARFPALGGPTYTVDLRASTNNQTTEHTISRVRWDSDITAREIDHDTVVGTLYEPAGDGPHPAIIDLHGSAGRMSDNGARRYASEGYATLALHYFGDPDPLPDTLEHIPLSYVDDAADWLLDQDSVAGDHIGLVGVSRGAELALALGARRDYVGCVISYSGSIPWDTPSDEPAWLDEGTPVPHLSADKAPASWTSARNPSPTSRPPLRKRAVQSSSFPAAATLSGTPGSSRKPSRTDSTIATTPTTSSTGPTTMSVTTSAPRTSHLVALAAKKPSAPQRMPAKTSGRSCSRILTQD